MGLPAFPKIMPQIQTQHLLIRPLSLLDCGSYFELISDPEVMAAYGVPAYQNLSDASRLIEFFQAEYQQNQSVRWGIFLLEQPLQVVGDIGFWRLIPSRYRAEVGAKLKKSLWGRGLMPEALRAVAQMGFEQLGLHSIEGHVEVGHTASERLVHKVGFHYEGLLREHSYDSQSQQFKDTQLFSLLKRDLQHSGASL